MRVRFHAEVCRPSTHRLSEVISIVAMDHQRVKYYNITLFLRPDVGLSRLIYSASTNISQHGISSEDLSAYNDSSWVVGWQASRHCLIQHGIVPIGRSEKDWLLQCFQVRVALVIH